MAIQTKNYFENLFVVGYNVQAQNLIDLCDSIMFPFEEVFLSNINAVFFYFFGDGATATMTGLNLKVCPDISQHNPGQINFSNNLLSAINFGPGNTELTVVNLSINNFGSAAIETMLQQLAALPQAIAIDITGGTNASHATWTAAALAAEATIILHGGTVASNP